MTNDSSTIIAYSGAGATIKIEDLLVPFWIIHKPQKSRKHYFLRRFYMQKALLDYIFITAEKQEEFGWEEERRRKPPLNLDATVLQFHSSSSFYFREQMNGLKSQRRSWGIQRSFIKFICSTGGGKHFDTRSNSVCLIWAIFFAS